MATDGNAGPRDGSPRRIAENRVRWLRQTLTDAGSSRAIELGWPNTYTFTKSLSESLIRNFLDANPSAAIAVVRPAIVESSIEKPFLGWNEGINTSASLSYLLPLIWCAAE